LEAAEDAETIMESPWAADACSDIAHGFLTAHLEHPGLRVQDFCPLYARDLQAMHSAKPTAHQIAERANQEMQVLRKRGAKDSMKRRLSQASLPKTEVVKQANLRAPPAPILLCGSHSPVHPPGIGAKLAGRSPLVHKVAPAPLA
jgi:hypothetical protein